MSLLSEQDQKAIKERFLNMKNNIKILFFTEPTENQSSASCRYCKDTLDILQELVALDERISLVIYDIAKDEEQTKKFAIDKVPAIVLLDANDTDYGIRFYGIPAGYEFATLIEDIIMVSSGENNLSTETKEKLKKVTKNIHIQVFVTPT